MSAAAFECPHGHEMPATSARLAGELAADGSVTPMDILWGEHRVIEQVLSVLEQVGLASVRDQAIPSADALAIIELLKTFADTCHHGKEEDLLFPAMERASGGTFQPVDVMREEHVQGRGYIAAMAAAIESNQVAAFASAAESYVALLRQHIEKEDLCLFGFASELLTKKVCDELIEAFHKVEHEDLGSGVHERMLSMADDLANRYGVARATDDGRVRALVTAHCGCPTPTLLLNNAKADLTTLVPLAKRVGLVHRGHQPVAQIIADEVTSVHDAIHAYEHQADQLDPLSRWQAQDGIRGSLRRITVLTDGFHPFENACKSVLTLYSGLQATVNGLEQWFDHEEQSIALILNRPPAVV